MTEREGKEEGERGGREGREREWRCAKKVRTERGRERVLRWPHHKCILGGGDKEYH